MKKMVLVIALAGLVAVLWAPALFAQWQPDVRLTNNDSLSRTSCYNNAWCVAAVVDSVHVVWFDGRDGNQEIYYKRSTNNGSNWGSDARLTQDSGVSCYPSIAALGSLVHVVWEDERDSPNLSRDVFYKRSVDNGGSWSGGVRLSKLDTMGSVHPSVAATGSYVHVVWEDSRVPFNTEVYYTRSADYGASWGGETRLSNSAGASMWPSVSASGSNVHVVWNDFRSSVCEVWYNRSPTSGQTWAGEIRLSDSLNSSGLPCVASSGSTVHVVWIDSRDANYEVYYKRSTNDGVSWGPNTRLTYNPDVSQYPSISCNGSTVEVVWYDGDGGSTLFAKRSTDDGASWGPDTRLTTGENQSVAVSSNAVHVVWWE